MSSGLNFFVIGTMASKAGEYGSLILIRSVSRHDCGGDGLSNFATNAKLMTKAIPSTKLTTAIALVKAVIRELDFHDERR